MIRSRILALAAGACVAATALCAQSASPIPPKVKSKKESEAISAMYKAQGPDAQIAAAQDLITRYADTEFKAAAFYVMAFAADMKRDLINVVVYGEQSIAADPMNFGSMALMSRAIAQGTGKFDLDKAEKIARAQKLGQEALELAKKAPKPNPQLSDEQWAAALSDIVSPAYEGLAYAAMAGEKFDECAAELKLDLDSTPRPDPALMVRAGICYRLAKKYDEAVAMFDRAIADPNSVEKVKQVAAQQKKLVDQSRAASK